jgi:putative phosphoribosyl transferase
MVTKSGSRVAETRAGEAAPWTPEGVFAGRRDAGRRLAELVDERLAGDDPRGVVVLGVTRGGVPVAYEVARRLGAPLDVLVVRKLGLPWAPEIAMGAVAEDDVVVLDQRVVTAAAVDPEQVGAAWNRERSEVLRRVNRYRRGRPDAPSSSSTTVSRRAPPRSRPAGRRPGAVPPR